MVHHYGDVIDCVCIVQIQFISEILRMRAQNQADTLLFTHLDAKVTTIAPSYLIYSVTNTRMHAHTHVLCVCDRVRVCVFTCNGVCTQYCYIIVIINVSGSCSSEGHC